MKDKTVTFEDLPKYGDHMTIQEFRNCCKSGLFIDYDGFGYLATKDSESNIEIRPSNLKKLKIPKWTTHVMWYNK